MSMGPPPSRRPSSAPAGRGARRGGFGGAPRGTFDARTLYEVDDGLGGFGRTRYVQRRTAQPAQRISAFGSYVGSHPGRRADKGRGVSSVGFQPERLIGGGALDGGRDRRTQFALPLHDACWRDDVGRVGALLDRGAAVDARELYGETQAVHVACSANAVRSLRVLLDRGADVDALAVDDVTPCHACCGREDASDCLELLLRRGADPTVRDARGRPPLHKAKTFDAAKCSPLLLPYAGRSRPAAAVRRKTAEQKRKTAQAWDAADLYRARRNGSRLRPAPGGDSHVRY